MKTYVASFLLCLLTAVNLQGQIKIGENPQTLDPSSVLELESSSRVLVITRLTDTQMNNITPLRGALVYNTDEECIHYYDGIQWVNICEALDNSFTTTTEAIFNTASMDNTVVVTQVDDNYNFEVNQITGDNITDSTILGADIGVETVGANNLADKSVTLEKLLDGNLAGELLRWNGTTWEIINESSLNIVEVDGDITNELQDLSITGNILSLSDDPTAVPIDLSTYINNDTNELQDLSITGNILSLSDDPTAVPIDLSTYVNNDTNELQDLSITGNILSLSDDPTAVPIDLSTYVNNDTNELQDLSITGNILSLSDDPTAVPIDLSTYVNNDTNELSDITLNTTTLELTNPAAGATGVDLNLTFATDAELATGGGNNLATNNLTQIASTNRSYDLNNGNLSFTGTGNVGIGTTTPNSKLSTNGSFATAINRLSGTINLDETHHTVILTADATINFPSVANSIGRIYIIKNALFVVSTNGYTSLDGTSGVTNITAGQTIKVQSDGVEWQQIN